MGHACCDKVTTIALDMGTFVVAGLQATIDLETEEA